jgi:hypothetical protein
MSEVYTDYVNKIVLSLPDKFIDVKTGATYSVTPKMYEQVEYHTNNNTLIHLLLSALNSYLHPKVINGSTEKIMIELSEIKNMLQQGYSPKGNFQLSHSVSQQHKRPLDLGIKDVDDVLDAFGG